MELAVGGDALGVGAGLSFTEAARSRTHWNVYRWDDDATSWVSRQLGGGKAGSDRFVQPSWEDFQRFRVVPYEQSLVMGNLITNAGWGRIATLAIGGGGTAYASGTCRIGAADGTGTAAGNATDFTSDTGTGATHRFWQPVSGSGTATNGTGTSGTGSATLAFASTFGTADGNFAWNQFAIDQGTATGTTVTSTMLNLKTSIAQGTKASGQTWTATCTFSFTSS